MLCALVTPLLLGAFVVAVGLLGFLTLAATWAVHEATVAAREHLRRDLAALPPEQIRTRLLTDGYFAADLRQVPAIREFLAGLQAGDEVPLAARYSRRRLYGMLARAESAAGRSGRPEAVDTVDEIYEGLRELARRARR
jgi:hypothetical protein